MEAIERTPTKAEDFEKIEKVPPAKIPSTFPHRGFVEDCKGEAFSIRFSPTQTHMAAGCADGVVRVYNPASGRLIQEMTCDPKNKLPVTSVAFRKPVSGTRGQNILLIGTSSGFVQHWHVTSGKCLHTLKETGNEINAVCFSDDSSKFATAGRDMAVRVYDEATRRLTHTLTEGYTGVTAGHSNRIFSVKFHPDDSNMVLSAGWDKSVQIWDLRAGHSVHSIFG
ncbi:WD domain G-beta repeat, partial [Aduncisulcus paluster]